MKYMWIKRKVKKFVRINEEWNKRKTTIKKFHPNGYLFLVAASNLRNIAANGKATQSDTGWDGVAELAIDGNPSGQYYEE